MMPLNSGRRLLSIRVGLQMVEMPKLQQLLNDPSSTVLTAHVQGYTTYGTSTANPDCSWLLFSDCSLSASSKQTRTVLGPGSHVLCHGTKCTSNLLPGQQVIYWVLGQSIIWCDQRSLGPCLHFDHRHAPDHMAAEVCQHVPPSTQNYALPPPHSQEFGHVCLKLQES